MSNMDMKEEKKQEVKTHLSLNSLNSDIFAMLELKKNMAAVIDKYNKKMNSFKKVVKAIDKRVGETQLLISNELREGNKETVQYTLDCFENIQDKLEDVVYNSFSDDPKYDEIMASVADLGMEFDKEKKISFVKSILDQ